MRLSFIFLSAAVFLGAATPQGAFAAPAVPLFDADMGSDFRDPAAELELVKKKKRSDDGDSDERSGIMDYITASWNFDIELHEDAKDGMMGAWILGALFNSLGGNIWAPMIFYKDVPDSDAKSQMMMLGILSTVLFWVPGVFPFAFPGSYFFGLGFLAFVILAVVTGWFIFPRAIAVAASDAYTQGGGRVKKKKKKKVQEEEDE